LGHVYISKENAMIHIKRIVFAILLTAGSAANADIFDTGNFYEATVTPPDQFNEWRIKTNQLGGAFGVVRIFGDDINDVITDIRIENPVGATINSFALNISNGPGDTRTDIGAIYHIDHLANANARISLINISGDLGAPGPFEKIEARSIQRLRIGGDCHADIVASSTTTQFSPTDVWIEGDWASGSYANRSAALIDFIQVDGDVGVSPDKVKLWAAAPINRITVGGNFTGQIGENNIFVSSHPDIGLVEIGGDFIGSAAMTINSLDELVIEGDFDADVTLTTAMPADSIYDIGGTFASTASIALPADGLVGQIVVNSGNTSDDWLGNVTVGGVSLAEDYTALSYELGDGAVGSAPFNFHQRTSAPPSGLDTDRDCNPFHTEDVTVTPVDGLDEVVISHYGPVYVHGTGDHFTIEFKSDIFTGGGPSWVDVSGQFEVVSANTNNATAHRDVVIQPKSSSKTGFDASGRWRIRPVAGKVKCGDVAGNPDVVYNPGWYRFRVRQQPLMAGATVLDSGNGPVLSDLTTWLSVPYETNADGETNSQDFIDMVNEYQGD
jgi:hypothetical protein